MKWNKKLKKIIMGGTGFIMAAVIFFVGSMQSMNEVAARVRVFDKITEKYPAGNLEMNILEIVPYGDTTDNNGETVNAYSELGYFLRNSTNNQNRSLIAATHGTLLSGGANSVAADTYPNAMFQLRTHGLIRPSGSDAGKTYPIYLLDDSQTGAAIAPFLNYYGNGGNVPYALYEDGEVFVKGVYSLGIGDYQLADGYTLDENGTICEVVEEVVSGNSVSGNTVSGNEVVTKLIPVTDIDMSKQQLPTSKNGFPYIKQVESGTGNLTFKRSETVTNKTEYYGISDQALYYCTYGTAYFGSSDYFREFVLGDRKAYQNSPINYTTKQASAVTVQDIENASLIYISGKSVDFSKADANDLSEEVILEIYNREVLDHKAVMMDYACYGADSDSNVSKLATLLWRGSQSDILSSYPEAFQYEENGAVVTSKEMQNLDFMKGNALKDLKESMMTGANGNFVTGNVYVSNHHMADFENPKSLIDSGDVFANGDFNSAYKASVAQTGFAEVMGYIIATNKTSTTGSMPASVSPAVAIQYILISDGNPLTIMKQTLHVLEIQPVTAFLYNTTRGSVDYAYIQGTTQATNRDRFIQSYLGDYYDDKGDYISFTSMTVDEFNGLNDDLVETYDVIYIGSETTNKAGNLYYTGKLKTRKIVDGMYSSTQTEEATLPVYNDTNMNGMVYYNIGDEVKTAKRDSTETTYRDFREHLDIDTYNTRYNGRDITKNKLTKLKDYLKADGLILVAGDLMAKNAEGVMVLNPTSIDGTGKDVDHGRVDTSSNMYELLKYSQGYRFNYDTGKYENAKFENDDSEDDDTDSTGAYYKMYENLVSVRDIENLSVKKTVLEKYIATEKLELMMTSIPKEYSYSYKENTDIIDPGTITYMEGDKLVYEFIISTLTEDAEPNAVYVPSLYIDVNKDGKYSKIAENIRDVQIVVKASGAEAPRDADNNYLLSKNVEYQMIRELDDAFSGYLQWKINIQAKADENVHASAEGSTVVKNKGEDKIIKILQITKVNDSTLDLAELANDKNSLFAKYLDAVPGYKVVFHTMTTQQYSNAFDNAYKANGNGKSVNQYALEFFDSFVVDEGDRNNELDDIVGVNMLVFGYGDNFEAIPSNNAIVALKEFIENDRPVLMTHDFMIYASNHSQSAYLRDIVGADKYGVTMDIVTDKEGKVVQSLVPSIIGGGLNYLHSGVSYTRAKNNSIMNLIENSGKNVAYNPSYKDGQARGSTSEYTQGISNYSIYGMLADGKNKKWLNSDKVVWGDIRLSMGRGSYVAEKMNSGQITSYPYILADEIAVEQTHAQHLQLDLDTDGDRDGESDVVVWYALGKKTETKGTGIEKHDAYADDAAGPVPADSYYVYNKGNITYTGYGDSKTATGLTSDETQLFVNTLFAAFNSQQTAPSAEFFESAPDVDDAPINGLVVPYDENVTDTSSVLKDTNGNYKYQFYNPNLTWNGLKTNADTSRATPIYYRLKDTNFVRGKKYMTVEYYLKAEGNRVSATDRKYKLDDNTMRDIESISIDTTNAMATVDVINITDLILTYQVSEGRFATPVTPDQTTNALSLMESGVTYGFYLPMSYLSDDSNFTIYVKAKTRVYTESSQTGEATVKDVPGEGYSELRVTKTDLLDLK